MTRAPFGDPNGEQLVDGINTRFKTLFDAASLPLTNVAGTANDVTATLAPALDGDGLLDGMSFTITWTDENTGPMTLALNGGAPVPVLGADGEGLQAGAVGPGLRSLVSYVGGDFVLLSPTLLMGGSMSVRYFWAFEASGTWAKPDGLRDDTPVNIAVWGGGGGGGSGSDSTGGGGGGYNHIVMPASMLPDIVTVTVGSGGAINTNGGNSSFGSLVTGYGGERGRPYGAGNDGGGGGGSSQVGAAGGGRIGGGAGGISNEAGDDVNGGDARTIWGGGGGGGVRITVNSAQRTRGDGGWAVYGGGGGGARGGTGSGAGGPSNFGGAGGNQSQAGFAPAGGGGGGAAGARGEVWVWI